MKLILKPSFRTIILWLSLYAFFCVMFWRVHSWFSVLHSLIIVFSLVVLCLFESEVLVRYFLFKGKTWLFYTLTFITVILYSWLNLFSSLSLADLMGVYLPIKPHTAVNDYSNYDFVPSFMTRVFINLFTVLATVISCFQKKELDNLKIQTDLKNESLEMELRYLKSQINPHFLFNALNNVYSLVYMHDEKSLESILRLSEMLRYVMVDCQAETISLEKEIKYIDNYIDFRLMQFEYTPNVVFEKKIENSDCVIVPMMLQPIVENCFKYSGIENAPDGFIKLEFVQNNDGMTFRARNSVKSQMHIATSLEQKAGIGLANVRKRLELYYGERFLMNVSDENGVFEVVLTVKENKK
ncbi:MAG: histidine kinase [Bacteroidales bacterium]|nr:histidine kinase [Bacteroidales bacterium]